MILERLKKEQDFTNQEKGVARYILAHMEEVQTLSAEELAKASYTSKATVVRLSQKLGLEGYQELKLKLVAEMVQSIRVSQLLAEEPITEKSTYTDIIKTLPLIYDKAITATKLDMDKNTMIRINNRLQRADCIDIYGTGISYILAQSAAFKFATLGMECSAYESVNTHYLATRKSKKTVAFLITFTGANKTVINTAKYLRAATDNYIVGIVGRHNDDIKDLCDEIVEVPYSDSLLSLKVITSFTVTTYVLDIFFSLLLASRYEEHVKSALEMVTHESLRLNTTYWNLNENRPK